MNDAKITCRAIHSTSFRFTPEDDTFPVEVRMVLADSDEGFFEIAVREYGSSIFKMPVSCLGKLLPLLEAAYAATPEGSGIGDNLADLGLDDA